MPHDDIIPEGLCQCGCGQPTKVAKYASLPEGLAKGQPRRYLRGHNNLKSLAPYIVDPTTGCWVWQRQIDKKGYGVWTLKGRHHRAHRVMFERMIGPIPEGTEPDHKCRNRACVNPSHLEPVTHVVNMRRGVRTKLTEDQANEIRLTPKPITREIAQQLADRFGMSVDGIRKVAYGSRWSD